MVTGWVNALLLGIVGLILVFFPAHFIHIFIKDQAVLDAGTECLRIVSIGFVFYGFGMVLVNSFNGAGDTTTPLKINIFAYFLIEIPLAWILAIKSGMNQQGVFAAIVIAETIMTITAWFIFRKGKWKLKEV
jgi:Na+-driven multidrug efflux pump